MTTITVSATVTIVLTLLAFSGLVVSGNEQVVDFSRISNCSDAQGILDLTAKCLSIYDIPGKLPRADYLTNTSISKSELLNTIMDLLDDNATSKMCSNVENVVKASLCAQSVHKKCIPDIPLKPILYPSESVIRQNTVIACSNQAKFNSTCVRSKMTQILECTNITVNSFSVETNVSIFLEDLLCTTFILTKVCAEKYLKACGELTLQMYLLSKPDTSVCSTLTVVGKNNTTTTIIAAVNCEDVTSVKKSYLQSLIMHNVVMALPLTTSSSSDISKYILHSISFQENDTCSNLQSYQDAINSTLAIERKCLEEIMKPTVPDSVSVRQGLADMCASNQHVDRKCLSTLSMSACSIRRRRRRSFAQEIILHHICEDTLLANRCLVAQSVKCGIASQRAYRELLNSQLPSKCLSHGSSSSVNIIG